MELDAYCPFPWTRARITSEGKLAMCCFMRDDADRPAREAYLGNVLDQNFDAVWFSDLAQFVSLFWTANYTTSATALAAHFSNHGPSSILSTMSIRST